MPELVLPTVDVQRSFLVGMAEFQAEGRGDSDLDSMLGTEIRTYGSTWHTSEGFAAYVADLIADRLEETPRPDTWVPCTTWWYVEGDEYLGRLALRHRLTEHLLEVGGHIGYHVRPTARRRGHATGMLRDALPRAADHLRDLAVFNLGIARRTLKAARSRRALAEPRSGG